MVDIRRWWSRCLLLSFATLVPITAFAATPQVMINEVAWMGTGGSSSDEWIELYNPSNAEVDLAGWKIVDDGTTEYKITTGKIAAKGYFLIEDSEKSTSIKADVMIPLSLSNSGDSLKLYDAQATLVDVVNSNGKAWFAGDSPKKATMERVDFNAKDEAASWKTAIAGNAAHDRKGGRILGTPRSINSVSTSGPKPIVVRAQAPKTAAVGSTVTVAVSVDTISDLMGYGVDLVYDATKVTHVATKKGSFLNYFGNDNTSFQSGLLGSKEGRLVVAEARITNPQKPISGKGLLFSTDFKVVGKEGQKVTIAFDTSKSFLKGKDVDFSASFSPLTIAIAGSSLVASPKDFVVSEGAQRYTLHMKWKASPSSVDGYIIQRKAVDGSFVTIDTTSSLQSIDKDGIPGGGSLIPHVSYTYRVLAYRGAEKSTALEVIAKEKRGLKADITRDDRVDGRDLMILAEGFGRAISHLAYQSRADFNYDGMINGNDLVDLGLEFAKTYTP